MAVVELLVVFSTLGTLLAQVVRRPSKGPAPMSICASPLSGLPCADLARARRPSVSSDLQSTLASSTSSAGLSDVSATEESTHSSLELEPERPAWCTARQTVPSLLRRERPGFGLGLGAGPSKTGGVRCAECTRGIAEYEALYLYHDEVFCSSVCRSHGCWQPDQSPATSLWRFTALQYDRFDIRAEPRVDAPLVGDSLEIGEVFNVDETRSGASGIRFLHLADGRGWVFDRKPDTGNLCVPYEACEEGFPKKIRTLFDGHGPDVIL